MSESLTRENRYMQAPLPAVAMGDDGTGPRFTNVVRCRSCGSLLLAVDEDLHERMHPPISCGRAHPDCGVYCTHPHDWEDQFHPR